MKIRRFEGKDTQEALLLAQQALGADAVILQTRRVKAEGLTGLLGTTRVEVLAAVDPAPRPPAPAAAPRPRVQAAGAAPARSSVEQDLLALRLEVAQLKNELAHQRPADIPSAPAEVSARIAPRSSPNAERRTPNAEITNKTIDIRPGRCTTVAFIGPTGVGKTTTLAKLAAVASHVEKKKVALVTVDTYRIAAVEQLETYARLLSVPMTVARTPQEVAAARATYADYDLLLIDTVGRSPRAAESLEELAALVDAARPDERHLLLDAGAGTAATRQVLEGFSALAPTHLALAKLDQTPTIDDVLTAALDTSLPFSYATTGQSVPEDLTLAATEQLRPWMGARA